MRTEDELVGALRAAAERAPDDGDLLSGVTALRRRRNGRRARVAAAAAAVVALGLGVRSVALSGGGEGDVATTPSPTVTLDTRPTPAERLWPGAVVTVPTENAEGMRYQPITGISATQMLLLATSPGKDGRIEVYDTAAGKARVVAEAPGAGASAPPVVTADGANVAWYAFGRRHGMPVREIWTAALSGGKPRKITTVTGDRAYIDAITINGDRIIWSEQRGDVWTVPLSGGSPERIPFGKGLRLVRWPWASDAPAGPDNSVRSHGKLVDLTIGHTVQVVERSGTKGLRCGPHWCAGYDRTGRFLQRIDGSRWRRLDNAGDYGRLSLAPILNRFVLVEGGIYDAESGRLATVAGGWTAFGASGEQPTVIYWKGGGGTFRVLNLAAVPPAQ